MTAEMRQRIEQQLRRAGLRLTPQRFAVLDFLLRTESHPTAEEIGAGINRNFPRASRATIYNTVHTLCEAGLVQETYFEDGMARYDANVGPHHHFLCRVCGRLEDVPSDAVTAFPGKAIKLGYRIENYQIVVRGVCARCAASQSHTNKRR